MRILRTFFRVIYEEYGENSQGSSVVKMLFYEVQHFSPNLHCYEKKEVFYSLKFVCGYFYWL